MGSTWRLLQNLPFPTWGVGGDRRLLCECRAMPGLKKLKKKRKFNYGRNRSRVRKQQEKTSKFNVAVKVDCKAMKDVWNSRVSLKENMDAMGVAVNANTVLPKISAKKKMLKDMKKRAGKEEVMEDVEEKDKTEVVKKLEVEAAYVAKQTFRFTPSQVQLITHMMDKHGEDWEGMARDPKNHYQETPAKLRGMIRKFISIPEHYVVYCKERGLIQPSSKSEEPHGGDNEEMGEVGEEGEDEDLEESDED